MSTNPDQTPADQPEEATDAANTAPVMPADAEQIGTLIFVPNADYPYPFKVATPPRFWMEETTGALSEAVDAYMNGERLATEHLQLIRLYLRQFIERAQLAPEANRKVLLSKIDKLKTTTDIENYADEISEFGAEVF